MGPKVLYEHLPPPRQARGVRAWVEAEDRAHRLGRQGFRDVSTPTEPADQSAIQGMFLLSHL